MKAKRIRMTVGTLGLLLALALSLAIAQGQAPQESTATQAETGTAFTYQGRLADAVGPVTGTCDFTFDLYSQAGSGDPPTGGTLLGTDLKPGVEVSEGLFTVKLDFGAGIFYGQARWLQTTVDCGSGTVTLSPRQELTPVPYALALPGLWTQQTGGTPNIIGGNSANTVRNGVVGATIGGGGQWSLVDCWPEPFPWGHGTCPTNWVTDNYGTVSGGARNQAGNDNVPADDAIYATVAGGYGNTASGAGAFVGGGGFDGTVYLGNQALAAASNIGGGGGNVIADAGAYATVGGGYSNTAADSYATIGGGKDNQASSHSATVGGGQGNYAGPPANGAGATVSGGLTNAASGWAATVGGGRGNYAGATFATVGGGGPEDPGDPSAVWPDGNVVTDEYGTIGGGGGNQAGNDNEPLTDAIYATVGGGRGNTAGAYYATVSGGRRNQALGWYSFIGGGVGNVTSRYAATVPGGWENAATGERSFAAGRRAKALHRGTFVWADDTDADFASTGANQFLIRASGGVGIGTTSPAAKLDVAGTTRTSVLQITGGGDLAEPFEIAGAGSVEPGMVVAIDPLHPGQLRIADRAYDRTVAGCVSGANGIQPGLVMKQEGTVADGAFPVALSGRVYCWADASYGAIQPGDLLTTSDTPGHVMVVTDYPKAQGAIIGKAMTSLEDGMGLILVLVSLQ